ncbi:hypothetical protein [Caldicoprobacter algeriensis]|nr:hypothetical protein [Caldicoprobacter algeriensis]
MKKALALVLATACFMIPTQALAETDLNQHRVITDYVNRICSITH